MAGYKQTVLNHSPVMFITFDGDRYDSVNRTLVASPPRIMDESGYANHAILHNELENFPSYRMGLPSLVHLEQTDQQATSFGSYGAQPQASNPYPKSFLEVPHIEPLALSKNRGSFTLSTFISKVENESAWREFRRVQGLTWTNNVTRPIMRKAGVFDMRFAYPWSGTPRIDISYPGGSLQWDIVTSWWYGSDKNHHIVFTWDVVEVNPNTFITTASLYVNARRVATNSHTYSDTVPTATSSAAVEIAGTINASTPQLDNDRITSSTTFDQMFILNKALTADEVARLFKKTRTYDMIITSTQPRNYWIMDDQESTTSNVLRDYVGNNNGVYQGGTSKIIRRQAGPSALPTAVSTLFVNGGAASANNTSPGLYSPVNNLNTDYSVEFWASFESSNRSVLFSLQRDVVPYSGILIEANVRNGVAQPGHIQFSINADDFISSRLTQDNGQPFNFATGQMHHFCVVYRAGMMELWINGIMHSSKSAQRATVQSPGPGQIYFMGATPGRLNTTGKMSNVAMYDYALDPQVIRMRPLYNGIYKIQGRVTLQGIPHQATIRAMRNQTGELVKEILSDNNSGDYTMTLYDNSLIDLIALNKQDRNVRYRVYGPITPAYYGDTP